MTDENEKKYSDKNENPELERRKVRDPKPDPNAAPIKRAPAEHE